VLSFGDPSGLKNNVYLQFAGPKLAVVFTLFLITCNYVFILYVFSCDGRLLAVSLLDSTVKVFFADTLKVRTF